MIYFAFAKIFSYNAGLMALAFLLIIFIKLEFVRIELGKKVPLISKLRDVKRQKEKRMLVGKALAELVMNLIIGILVIRTSESGVVWWLEGASFGSPI